MKTRTLLLANCLLYACVILIISCQKELSFEIPPLNDDSTAIAIYTLSSENNNCTGVNVAGTYMDDIVMNASNTAEIQVNVAREGSYILTTDTVNGISFYANGIFEKTGNQKVVLTAGGRPESEGEKKYLIIGTSNKCSFSIKFARKAPPAKFTFAGAPNNCTDPVVKGTYAAGTELSTANTVTLKVNVTTAGSYSITTTTENGISFSGEGLFSSTGTNMPVILTGSGTPLQKGATILKTNINSGCSFTIPVADKPPVASGILTCKIDGMLVDFSNDASASTKLLDEPYLKLDGNRQDIPEDYFRMYITNNDNTPVKAGTYNEKNFAPTSLTQMGYRIEVAYNAKNPDLSTTTWNTSSNIPMFSDNNPPFTIKVATVTATRVKGTFSGKLADLNDKNKTKTVTEGVFDLPVED